MLLGQFVAWFYEIQERTPRKMAPTPVTNMSRVYFENECKGN
jgi:hypothetical protein